MQLNLKEIAKVYCEGCVLTHEGCYKHDEFSVKCFDRLLKLHQTIALQEIALTLSGHFYKNDKINKFSLDNYKDEIFNEPKDSGDVR